MTYGEADSYQGAPQVGYQRPDVNESARYAAQHGEEEHGLFSNVLSSVLDRDDDDHKRPMEEHEVNEAADAHDRIYNQGAHEGASSRDMGSAAAMQAFKMFSSSKGSGGGGGSSELIGLAMGEAMKLYKSSAGGGGGGGNQAEMLQSAAGMAMKLLASQGGGSSGGSSGGIGALMGMLGQSGKSSGGGGAAALISKFM
ncbi:unnamed protein product [Absidia cylindrospora]